jgi:hypothetical protein
VGGGEGGRGKVSRKVRNLEGGGGGGHEDGFSVFHTIHEMLKLCLKMIKPVFTWLQNLFKESQDSSSVKLKVLRESFDFTESCHKEVVFMYSV